MRISAGIVFVLALGWFSASSAAGTVPAACSPDVQGQIDYQACADQASPGSPERAFALINLGTAAFLRQDYAAAVRLYDEAQPPGGLTQIYSDASFHAYRAVAYDHVGRSADALANARTTLAMLQGEGPQIPGGNVDPATLYADILPILKKSKDPGYATALAAYRALPARDWIDYANQAAVLTELESYPEALVANDEALKLAPDEPVVLNNACELLTKLNRAAEGLSYCERAVAAAPSMAAVHDSYADALAAVGRCQQAMSELATAHNIDPVSVASQRSLPCTAVTSH